MSSEPGQRTDEVKIGSGDQDAFVAAAFYRFSEAMTSDQGTVTRRFELFLKKCWVCL
jgi:hypothetical protein